MTFLFEIAYFEKIITFFWQLLERDFEKKTNAIKRYSLCCYLDAFEIVRDSTGDELRMEPLHHEPYPSITSRKS